MASDNSGAAGWISDFVGALFDKWRTLGAGLAGRILTGLGLYIVHTKYTSPALAAFLQGHATGATAEVLNVLAYINLDKAISMIIGAYVARAVTKLALAPLSALTGGGS
jgi:hypothetical protein